MQFAPQKSGKIGQRRMKLKAFRLILSKKSKIRKLFTESNAQKAGEISIFKKRIRVVFLEHFL